MARPFFKRLNDYFTSVGNVLRGESDIASIFPNTTDIGSSREQLYAEFLKQHIPSTCNVLFGGFLFDQDGNESKQIDVLVIGGDVLQFNFHNPDGKGKAFSCIDGCIAVAAIKSNLNSAELINAFDNLSSLPEKKEIVNSIDLLKSFSGKKPFPEGFQVIPFLKIEENFYKDWPFKIIYASKGINAQTAITTIEKYYQEHIDIPFWKRPNLIHVAGQYVIVRIPPSGGKDQNGKDLKPHTFHAIPECSDAYGLLCAVIGIQKIVSSSRHIFYKYKDMCKNLLFQ